MKTPEEETLLGDVLCDESYAGFRAQVRDRMSAEIRRCRAFRRAKQLLALAACVAGALGIHWILAPRAPVDRQAGRIAIVRSVPLKPEQIVTTVAHGSAVTVMRSRDVEISSLRLGIFETVATVPAKQISDEELLDLFKGRAVALVNSGSGKRLLFLDEESSRSTTP